jgi:two-component system, NarL family, response regulator DevR
MKSPVTLANTASVLLVDDHAVVRIGLKAILGDDQRVTVLGEAANGAEALALLEHLRPTVVLLDLRLPGMPGIELCRRIKAFEEPPKVLILTSFGDEASVLDSIAAGADGYILKDFSQTTLATAILIVASGGSFLDPSITRKVMDAARPGLASDLQKSLSPQERRILDLIAVGKQNKEVASELRLAEGTIRNSLTTIFSKLGVENRIEAVTLYLKRREAA